MARKIVMLIVLWLIASVASADPLPLEKQEEEQEFYYQWVDEKGVPHFVDRKDMVPEAYRDKSRKLLKNSAEPTLSGPKYEGIDPGQRTHLRKEQNKLWRQAFVEIRTKKAMLKKAIAKQQKALESCPVYDAIDPQLNHAATQCRSTAEKELERLKKELQKANALLLETKEKGRQAGVPPGTFRN